MKLLFYSPIINYSLGKRFCFCCFKEKMWEDFDSQLRLIIKNEEIVSKRYNEIQHGKE
jgi:hypothetical protein